MISLYHGSNIAITTPDLIHSKPYKDFGRGFYLSADKQQALDMAFQKVNQTKDGQAVVTEFLFDETQMSSKELNVLSFDDYSENWARFVLANRDRSKPYKHEYDIVYGPIADDGVTYQLRRYAGGVISLPQLVAELKYAKGITFQYYFGTKRALQYLKRV